MYRWREKVSRYGKTALMAFQKSVLDLPFRVSVDRVDWTYVLKAWVVMLWREQYLSRNWSRRVRSAGEWRFLVVELGVWVISGGGWGFGVYFLRGRRGARARGVALAVVRGIL